ncbi:TPA: hypothetical protein JLS65_004128 [Escherichia coli]|nr:hypothetical protein [Escherichia coli]
MLFFWCGFFSSIVLILSLSQGYNERLYLDEQDRITKENIYVDYLSVNADVLSEICATEKNECNKIHTTLPEAFTAQLKAKLSNYDNSITPRFCISNGKIIVYTSHNFNIERYKDSSLLNLYDVPSDIKSACLINDNSGIAVIKTFNK